MVPGTRPCGPIAVLLLLLASGCDKATTPTAVAVEEDPAAAASSRTMPFDDAALFFEFNTTDNDLGLQLFLDSEGWRRVRVIDPAANEIVLLEAKGRLARLGITELRFESAEPSPEEVLALFRPGQYRFRGRSVEGEQLASDVSLSHDLPPAPSFTPSGGQAVDPRQAVVEWNTPGAEQVELIIEQDELGHVFDVIVSASTRRMRIPAQFLTPGMEYKIEILSIAENGNRTIAESTFRTGP
jgi:hypothetical protein